MSAVPPPVCNFGIRIVGGHTVHVLVEAAVRIAGVRIIKHADGVHGHAAVLQIVGQIDSVGGYSALPRTAGSGLAICENHHDLLGFLTGTTQSMLPVAVQYPLGMLQTVVHLRGAGSVQRIDRAFQFLDIAAHLGQILHNLGVVIATTIVTISDTVTIITSELDNADPMDHIVFRG